jgi:hypothetical protein
VDDVPQTALVSPTVSMKIRQREGAEIEIRAYQHPTYKWIIHSSENPMSYFADEQLIEKLFVGSKRLTGS